MNSTNPVELTPTCLTNIIRATRNLQIILFAIALIALTGTVASLFLPPPIGNILFSACMIIGPIALLSFHFSGSLTRILRVPGYTRSLGEISISIEKRALKEQPNTHLQLFAEAIGRLGWTRQTIDVHFIGQRGVDGGGLTYDYLDDLVGGVTEQENLFTTVEASSLAVPQAGPQDALQVFERLGRVMMFCHRKYTIGYHIDPSVFAVAFQFTAREINAPFESLSNERKLELYRVLAGAQEHRGYDALFNLLLASFWSEEQIELARNLTAAEDMRAGLMELANTYLEKQVRAIHAVAKGMKAQTYTPRTRDWMWDHTYHRSDAQAFSTRLQGAIDRDRVAECIRYCGFNNEVQRKVGWLKTWVRTEATNEEIKQLLKYITGTSGLASNDSMSVIETTGPSPAAHTCGKILELPSSPSGHELFNDHTEENFINWMKNLIAEDQSYSVI